MAVSPARASEVLAKCARHCCICRRFRPLHLQVHHIEERGEGGDDELDNLISLCVSCHCDVHTETKLTRRFTHKELKLHRESVYQLVADGKLVAANEDADQFSVLSASIISKLSSSSSSPVARPQLSTSAVQILLIAARGDGVINTIEAPPACFVLAGETQLGDYEDPRLSAKLRKAIRELHACEVVDGDMQFMTVSDLGYLVADDILSAEQSTAKD